MIVLKPSIFDAAGNIKIAESLDSDLGGVSRRISRRATIDGGVWIDDFGSAEGDRTISVYSENVSDALYTRVLSFVKNYGSVELICSEGVFSGHIERVNKANAFELVFLVKERLDG